MDLRSSKMIGMAWNLRSVWRNRAVGIVGCDNRPDKDMIDQMLPVVCGLVGRRLTYRHLIAGQDQG